MGHSRQPHSNDAQRRAGVGHAETKIPSRVQGRVGQACDGSRGGVRSAARFHTAMETIHVSYWKTSFRAATTEMLTPSTGFGRDTAENLRLPMKRSNIRAFAIFGVSLIV